MSNPEEPRRRVLRESVPVPNFFFDEVMPRVKPLYFCVLLFIWRKTVGWNKEQDWIALSQIQSGVGVCRNAVLGALRLWREVGLLRRAGRLGIRGTVTWGVVLDYDKTAVISRLDGLVHEKDRFISCTSTGSSDAPPPVHPANTQKRNHQKILKRKGPPHPLRETEDELQRQERARQVMSRYPQRLRAAQERVSALRDGLKRSHLPFGELQRLREELAQAEGELAGLAAEKPPDDGLSEAGTNKHVAATK